MDALLIGINSKFIHPNVAIRLIKKNSKHNIRLLEFTIKDDKNKIVDTINNAPEEIVGLSVYIWNVCIIKEILPLLKKRIVLGGPEVSYDSTDYFNFPIEWIIKGEGERSLDLLLEDTDPLLIPGLSYRNNDEIIVNPIEELSLEDIQFGHAIDFHPAQIQYIETSRGCPFSCSFCLASLEKMVRYFPIDRVLDKIDYLIENNAKTVKFLDRTFNLNVKNSIKIISYIIKHHNPGMSFQFEITGEILDQRIMDVINTAPKGLFRFEIGIQSTYEKTNLAVKRKQDTMRLFKTIREIQEVGIVDLHLDLIAGLPYETLDRFKETFNQTFNLHSKELQLGILKLLKGAELRYEDEHEFIYNDAPYEMISNKYLSQSDLNIIKVVEDALEHTWNKGYMNKSLIILTKTDPFQFFYDLGNYIEKKHGTYNIQLDTLFTTIDTYTNHSVQHQLIIDYLNYQKIKPKRWWKEIDKKMKNSILRDFHKENPSTNLQNLFKYSLVVDSSSYIIAYYHPTEKFIKEYKK